MRIVWLVAGLLAVGVGGLGVIVPGLPTTVFFIIAAWCFSRSSKRLEQWVLDLPRIGPMVAGYRAGLGMPRRAKFFAVTSIVVATGISAGLLIDNLAIRLVVAAVGAFGVWWVGWNVPTREKSTNIIGFRSQNPLSAGTTGQTGPRKSTPTPGGTPVMALRINDVAPDFTAETTEGTISFHEWIGDGWALLFSHPKDFTPVCTTELGAVAGLKSEFDKRNCKVIGISVDGVSDHEGWSGDIETATGNALNYPLIGDPNLDVVKLYDMLPADAGDSSDGRTPADNATARSVFVIGPDKKIKATLTYPMTTGRNFAELLRLVDSIQLTATEQVATPADWQQGGDVIIVPGVSDEQAKEKYPAGFKAPLPYLRYVKQPG